jgi:5-methylcytosine-specific restriction endonuclease McrA
MMNECESMRTDDPSDGTSDEILADLQRDPARSRRLVRSRAFSPKVSADGSFDRDLRTTCFYRKYIQSSAWRDSAARLGELEASGNRCRLCDAPSSADDPLQVHHRTYARLGCELQRDLTALCADCHRGVTSMLRERRYETTTPVSADIVLSGLRQCLLDPTREEAE